MIDPFDLSDKGSWDEYDIQCFGLFCCAVANKPADLTKRKLYAFLKDERYDPLDYVAKLHSEGNLRYELMLHKLSPYNRVESSFRGLHDLHTNSYSGRGLYFCDVQDLESINGIGPKTARYFLMYTRPNYEAAVIDTHILKEMRALGWVAPLSTPSGQTYLDLERRWLTYCKSQGKSPKEMDTEVWLKHAKKT